MKPNYQQLSFSLAVGHANRSRTMEKEKQERTSETCGLISFVSFAKLDPGGSWVRMYQGYYQLRMDNISEICSGSWPASGMMRNGVCYQPRNSERPTREKGSFLLPTPLRSDGRGFYVIRLQTARKCIAHGRHTIHSMKHGIVFHKLKRGWGNPVFSEAMMGLPSRWTDLRE